MSYYHIIRSYQKLKLTLNVICHLHLITNHVINSSMSCYIFLVKIIVKMTCVMSSQIMSRGIRVYSVLFKIIHN